MEPRGDDSRVGFSILPESKASQFAGRRQDAQGPPILCNAYWCRFVDHWIRMPNLGTHRGSNSPVRTLFRASTPIHSAFAFLPVAEGISQSGRSSSPANRAASTSPTSGKVKHGVLVGGNWDFLTKTFTCFFGISQRFFSFWNKGLQNPFLIPVFILKILNIGVALLEGVTGRKFFIPIIFYIAIPAKTRLKLECNLKSSVFRKYGESSFLKTRMFELLQS